MCGHFLVSIATNIHHWSLQWITLLEIVIWYDGKRPKENNLENAQKENKVEKINFESTKSRKNHIPKS